MRDEFAGLQLERLAGYTSNDIPPVPTVRNTAGLEPRTSSFLTPVEVRHLYRRAAFGSTVAETNAALNRPMSDVVESLLSPRPAPAAPSWAFNAPYRGTLTTQQQLNYRNWIRELREWWIRLMITEPLTLTEKMTLFWHGHFATQYSTVQVPQYHYKQNALFRQYALGNFKELVKRVTIDPLMLIYLDGVRNRVGAPNENYARELMELFTIGIGNYTQTDIQQAAKALTGWEVSGLDAVFTPSRHDTTNKTFMGRTGNFDHNDIVDIIFEQAETARFICRKLYRYFIYQTPDETIVNQLADTLRSNNYEIRPVLRQLFNSAHFYNQLTMSAEITSPIEKAVSAIRQLNIPVAANSFIVPSYVRTSAEAFGQSLFEPPNVAGWPGYRTWISTTTLLARNQFTDAVITGRTTVGNTSIGFKVNPLTFALQFPNPSAARALVDDITAHLIAMQTSAARRQMLLDTLLQGTDENNWNINDPQTPSRIEGLLKVICRMAEYQLG
jgi:uncharacterized protein (DUF1800 family)